MIYLTATTDKFEVVSSAAALLDVNANYIDAATSGLTPPSAGRKNTAFTTATTQDVVVAPGASTTRTLKQMTIRNKDSAVTTDVTFRLNENGTAFEIHKVTLLPGECLQYIEGVGFFELTNASASRLLTNMEPSFTQRVFTPSAVQHHANLHTFLTGNGTAYYVYIGRVAQDITVKSVEFQITTAGAGTDTKEVGLFSTPTAPSRSTQTLSKIAATGTVDAGTSTGFKRNTASFAQLVPAGTHLWAALRGAMGTTQMTCAGLGNDLGSGSIMTTTGGGALTGLSTANGTLLTAGTTTVAPYLQVTLD